MTNSPPPISSTFISMEDFLATPDPSQSSKPISTQGLLSPAPSTRTSTGADADGASPLYAVPPSKPEPVNWVGLLMEYAAQRGSTPPAFADIPQPSALAPRFACTVKLDERSIPFGDPFQTFPRKKLAKQWACRVALEWLADNGYISPSRVPRAAELGEDGIEVGDAGEGAGGQGEGEGDGRSAVTRVPEVCRELGVPPPTYRMKNTPEAPMVWSGWAVWPLGEVETGDHGRVGHFEGVAGKRNAREVCARRVLEFLEGLKRRREGGMEL